MGVGLLFSTSSSTIIDLVYFMFFAAVTAAMRCASVELSAVMDCVLD